jgi:hypothetical protein
MRIHINVAGSLHRVAGVLLLGMALSTGRLFAAQPVTITNGSFEGMAGVVTSPVSVGLKTNEVLMGGWEVSASGLLGVNTSVAFGTSSSLGGPPAANGTYIAKISMPLGLGYMISLDQDLGQKYQPNSIYTLSVALDQGTVAGLFANATLSLRAGATKESSLNGAALVSLLDTKSGFQTVSLTYQTTATVPTGDIDVFFQDQSLLSLASIVYLDNFQLSVMPVPEPSSVAFFALLSGGFLFHYWKRKMPPGSAA